MLPCTCARPSTVRESDLDDASRDALQRLEAQPARDAPSVFTALQEQLALTLERQRGPADVVMIDRIQRPDPD
jgi:uncharacterized protein (TIGR03435 family)